MKPNEPPVGACHTPGWPPGEGSNRVPATVGRHGPGPQKRRGTAIGVQEGTQAVQLSDVTADRPNDAWAIGSARTANQATFEPAVEHWNGSSWSMVALPASALKVMGTASPAAKVRPIPGSGDW